MTTWVRALYLASGWFSQMTIAVSATVADRMTGWGVPAQKVAVIPNGVDLDRVAFDGAARDRVRAEFGAGRGEFVIGVLGRLDPAKQFHLVIEAAAPLLRAGRAKLVIVGKGTERERLEAAAAQHGVAGLVVFAGERHDVAGVLSAFDMFVASSAQETFGLSVLEALANGLPVAYTTCPALEGLAVARATQVPHTAAGLAVAVAAAVAAGQVERAPEPAVEQAYGIAAVTARIDDLYEQIADRPGPRRRAARLARRTRRAARLARRTRRAPVAASTAPAAAASASAARPAGPGGNGQAADAARPAQAAAASNGRAAGEHAGMTGAER
jgi:glycosyltransferase involved in cell wall biosynthesis